jgi:hypothetical protein
LLLLGLASGAALHAAFGGGGGAMQAAAPARIEEQRPTFDRRAAPGPWGTLEISEIELAPALDLVRETVVEPVAGLWYFPGWDEARLAAFLDAGPLPAPLRAELAVTIQAHAPPGGAILEPSPALVMELPPEARAYLYNELATHSINRAQANAHRHAGPSLERWMHGVPLDPPTSALLERLVYRNGRLLFFADEAMLLPRIADEATRSRVRKALARERTFLIKLRLDDDSDTRGLADYWGAGRRAKDVFPLLDSLQRRRGERTLDVVHLLPPFARRHLYTYPDASQERSPSAPAKDCHWTTVNFFATDGTRAIDSEQVLRSQLLAGAQQIRREQLRFGDVVLYLDGERLVHSSVHVADGIVFTKNGTNFSSPWMFSELDELVDHYARNRPITVVYLRRAAPGPRPSG